jgi:hypothetical protein
MPPRKMGVHVKRVNVRDLKTHRTFHAFWEGGGDYVDLLDGSDVFEVDDISQLLVSNIHGQKIIPICLPNEEGENNENSKTILGHLIFYQQFEE